MSYKSEIESKQNEIAAANEATRQQEAFHEFYSNPKNRADGIISCQANTSILRGWLSGVKITAQSLQDAVENTSVYQQLARTRSEAHERAELVNFIISNRTMSPQTSIEERARLSNPLLVSMDTLRTIHDRVRDRRAMESKSIEELREIVKAGQPQTGFDEVPEQYRTKTALLRLANTNLTLYKRLMQQCGRAALDAVIQRGE